MNIETLKITPELLSLISGIDEFKGAWRALGVLAPDRLLALKKVATIKSIGSSTRIEGSHLSDKEVESLLSKIDTQQFNSRDEQEVAGYARVLEVVFEAWEDIPLTENYLKQLHGVLLQYGDKDTRCHGHYKTTDNSVAAFDADGKPLGSVFQTATPSDTPRLMAELIAWLNDVLESKALHPLLVCSVFVVTFLAIHPFQDGNGRLSRVMTTWLLLKCGYVYVPYGSLESIIEQSKEAFYLALRQTQKTIREPKPNWQPWTCFFLRSLQKQTQKLCAKVKKENILFESLPERSLKILSHLQVHGRGSVGELSELLGENRNTVKAHFKRLVNLNKIVLHGKGRGAWYALM
jgi:Fic family protein